MDTDVDALPDEIVDAILNGASAAGHSRLDVRWRFAARAVCRRWRAIVDGASRTDMRRIRREVPRAVPRPNMVVHASAVAALARQCTANRLARADADRAAADLWSWASTLQSACDGEIAAAMLAASTCASIAAALAACMPTNAVDNTGALYCGGTLLRVAATYCADAQVVATLVDDCGARLTTEAMAACAGTGQCVTVTFMLLRAARSGDRVVLQSMARTAWLRAAWRDASGRTAALLARMALAPGACANTLPERAGDFCVLAADDRPVSREALAVCAAVKHTADDQTPWWWFTARWGNIRAFTACADRGMTYLPERALMAAAGAGRVSMCAWLTARDARVLGLADDSGPTVDARRRRLALALAVAAAGHGARCAPVFDWLRASLDFAPNTADAAAILDAALGVTPRAATLFGPLPHAILYALDVWPPAMKPAVCAASPSLWHVARDRLTRAVDMGHWNAADALAIVLHRVACVRGDAVGALCDVWASTIAAMVLAAANAPDGLCRLGDLRRVCALALRCVGPETVTHPTHDDVIEDQGAWHHVALVDPSWSCAGDRVAWRRCCRPTPVPRALLLGAHDIGTGVAMSPVAGLLVRWLDAVGLVADPEPVAPP
ncbi:F-box incomplete domain containing protein [Pandoravirus quercus]|uniref:F-box incomplete domain containing protein n=1 Tax=Pandoravirus quercus TaxID=2107709 RepID=A0A2U7UAK5_9VIRU|nr:F-box incomplete domain containing protein [Pandoravirus quercus]AVK75478.1 F-box incomplete domain containing protein [Pandoravirus quercus]